MMGAASLWAARFNLSGYVIDGATGETIIGVNIQIEETQKGTSSNTDGYYTLTGLSQGDYTLVFSHIAYKKKRMKIHVAEQNRILPDVVLESNVLEMQNVSIVADKSELADLDVETGHRAITSEAIRRIPASQGDVFQAIKHLPGIEGIDPVSPLYVVRGSDTGENLLLLDGVPIYNPYHFVNSSGLFNVYAIKNVELMVGGFGAEYGGRNGSVLYITTREGNNQKLHGEISPTTSMSSGVVDFPIGRNATVMLSGRWYCDLFSYFLFDSPNYFYDMNHTLTWKLGDRHRLTLRYFQSYDDLQFNSDTYFNYLGNTFDTDIFDNYDFETSTRWRNRAITAQLKSILTPSIYWESQVYQTTFSANDRSLLDFYYTDDSDRKIRLYMETDIRAKIQDQGIRTKLDMRFWDWNTLKVGGEWSRYCFRNDILLNGYSEGKLLNKPSLVAGFVEDKVTFGLLTLRPGIRFSKFGSQDDWISEIRLNAAFYLTDRVRLKAAWGEYIQNIISINTQEYEMSQYLDTYFPLGSKPPSTSRQSILGLDADLSKSIQFSLDIYHKDMVRTYDYDYNASQLEARSFLDKLRAGHGEAYGFEMLVKGALGKTSGWISYGWSRSTRSYPHIMQGKSHLFDYDVPHALKIVLNHQVSPALEFSGSIRVLSGMPKTLETSRANYYYYDPETDEISIWPQVVTPVKNNIRMPFILDVDFGLKKRLRKGFGAALARYMGADQAYLNMSVQNLSFFLHRNVWFYIQDGQKQYGVGSNYFPQFSFGYSIQF